MLDTIELTDYELQTFKDVYFFQNDPLYYTFFQAYNYFSKLSINHKSEIVFVKMLKS